MNMLREKSDESMLDDVDAVPRSKPFRICTSGKLGAHFVASRDLVPGEMVLLEAALVSTRTEVAGGLPDDASVEWHLVAALLTQMGSGKALTKWAARFCSDVGTQPGERADEEIAQALCSQYHCSKEEVANLHRVVRCNAFGLESALLGVEYGAAFYELACRMNHSCAPNCISIRIAGNMAVFIGSHVAAGTELTHSYLPPRLLVVPRSVRASHLHFTCTCSRCANESACCPRLAAMAFPPGHALSPEGTEVAAFKLASASGDLGAALEHGVSVLTSESCVQTLSDRPLAAIEVTMPFLSAYFAWQLGAGVGEGVVPGGVRHHALAAARLQAIAAARIRRLYDTRPLASDPAASRGMPAADQLADAALVSWALLEQSYASHGASATTTTNDELHAAAVGAMRRMTARFGGTLEWMRDDLPCLGGANQPTPAVLAEVLATACPADARAPAIRAAAAAAGLALIAEQGAREGRTLAWAFTGGRYD